MAIAPTVASSPQTARALTQVLEIPLSPRPQIFQLTLRGVTYTWQLYWLVPTRTWVVNINDAAGTPIINGLPLLPGSNLLGQFGYVGIGGVLFAYTDHTGIIKNDQLDYAHLGITGHLYWVNM
jgi:hypothetical protein